MMIPRLGLVAINLQPDWSGLSTLYSWELLTNSSPPDWNVWENSFKQPWNIALVVLLAVGFVLIAIAMAYAIIDVPSTGNARLPQRRFLVYRQIPLLLASLVLAEWWALFRSVHGDEPFRASDWLVKFVAFILGSYLAGELLATVVRSFRKREQKAWPDRVSRFAVIAVSAAFAGLCLWAMATRMFLNHDKTEFKLRRECDATLIPSQQQMVIPAGIEGIITQIVDGSYTVATPQFPARIAEKDRDALGDALESNPVLDPGTKLPKFTFKRDCEAIQIPTEKKTLIRRGTDGLLIESVEGNYTTTINARIAAKDRDALELHPAPDEQTQSTKFRLMRDSEATQIASQKKLKIPAGTEGIITQIVEGNYDARISARIAGKGNDAFELRPPLPAPAQHAVAYLSFAPALIMAVLLLVNFLFTGLASWVTEDEDREWWARSAAWILIAIVGWIVFNLVVLWGGQAISASPTGNALDVFRGYVKANPIAKAIFGAFGGVTGLVAALLALRSRLSKTLGRPVAAQWPLTVAAVAFFVLLSIVISWILLVIGSQPWVEHIAGWFLGVRPSQSNDPNYWRVQLFAVFFLTSVTLIFGILMGFFINANKFSLHATYRNRLIRAYLAASRTTRSPNRFTGFDPADNFELRELRSEKPLHILNGALNLVKGEQLAWQERKAESFTMSRLHCGSWKVGYRPSARYGHGITLGTALAISGAAANPNMGYHSSPVLGFLMTLFNVRLGWWLGNPGPAGHKTWTYKGPSYSVGPLFSEAVGNTTDHYKYVNLSDGGHFENLGLYEVVLRRCHYIVVSDGGQDPECSFADLGEAVRKIRIDFGIPIEFGPMTIYPRSAIETPKTPGHNCALGRIRYSVVDGADAPDGVIVYIKPACYGDEPRDIYEYYKRNETFPHESTSDQFFSESQFESYRMLGSYTMEKLCTDCGGDFCCFIRDILKRHLQVQPPEWLAGLLAASPNAPTKDVPGKLQK
jgi:hypothetical protein